MNFIKKNKIILFILLELVVLSIISIFIGAYDVSLSGIVNNEEHQLMILLTSRLPRLLAIIMVGIGMSIAGLLMQNITMNKFVSPTTGATISSAQLGILIAMIFLPFNNLFTNTLFAFVFALLGTWLFVLFIQRIKIKDVIMVPLIGIMFNFVIGALVSYFAYQWDLTQSLTSIMTGSFSLVIAGDYEIVFLIVPMVIIAWIFANHFNIVGMGENLSTNLGLNYKKVMFLGLSIAAIITAAVVTTVGSISYIGLIIPNIIAMFKGDKIRGSILAVGLLGAHYVLVCDIIARIVIMPYELPIELVSGIIGSIVFIELLYIKLNPHSKLARRFRKHENIETK